MVNVNITDELLRDFFVTAYEDGVNSEIQGLELVPPEGHASDEYRNDWHPRYNLPFVDGGKVIIQMEDPEKEGSLFFDLTRETMLKGMELMAAQAPKHFADAISENWDVTTAAAWIQFTTYGKVEFC